MCFISNHGHNVVYVRACPDPDCNAAGAWGEFRKGKLFVICTTCRFQFQLLPKVRLAGRGVGSGAELIRGSFHNQEG